LTDAQATLLLEYLDGGGRVVVTGELGENLDDARRARLLDHPRLSRAPRLSTAVVDGGPQVVVSPAGVDLAVGLQQVAAGVAVHVVRYDYEEARDEVPLLPRLELAVRLAASYGRATAHSPGGDLSASVRAEDGRHRLVLEDVPLYGIVLLADPA
jgi:hypothetical protein